jgi:hypothetical protein
MSALTYTISRQPGQNNWFPQIFDLLPLPEASSLNIVKSGSGGKMPISVFRDSGI